MRPISIAGVRTLKPDNYWSASLGELAMEAAAPLLPKEGVDVLICAAPSASFVLGQGDFAAVVADRLCISPKIALTIEAADASAASALQVARQLCAQSFGSALIVAAAKVSDLSEAERIALLDRSLDQEAECSDGLSFAAQAGLLAARYCRAQGSSDAFSAITAANHAAWARFAGRTAPTVAEIRRDLVVAPPLVRSDFAQLLDGAGAALLVADSSVGNWCIDAIGSGMDTVALWERADPLAFVAVERAVSAVLASHPAPQWFEFDTACSVAQRLTEDATLRIARARPDLVNIRGGSQGRGRIWGGSLIYQLQDIVECEAPFPASLMISVAGLGSHASAVRIARKAPS